MNSALTEELKLAKAELENCSAEMDKQSEERRQLLSKNFDLESQVKQSEQKLDKKSEQCDKIEMERDILQSTVAEANQMRNHQLHLQKKLEDEISEVKAKLEKEKGTKF